MYDDAPAEPHPEHLFAPLWVSQARRLGEDTSKQPPMVRPCMVCGELVDLTEPWREKN